MGITPYLSPVERERARRDAKHYDDFVFKLGYKLPLEIDGTKPGYYKSRTKPYVGPNGKSYANAEEYYAEMKWMPGLEKDGITYGYYQVGRLHDYKDRFTDECCFLISNGYSPTNYYLFSKDYLDNNRLAEEFYEKNGFVPRWIKATVWYGHDAALDIEGYNYVSE